MNVALIVEWLDSWRGGAETSTQQFIEHLLELGIELDVYTRSRVSSRPGLEVNTFGGSGPARGFKTLAFCRRADEAVRARPYDVVHALVPVPAATVYQPRGGTYAETLRRNVALRQSRSARTFKAMTQRLSVKQQGLLKLERRMLLRTEPPLVIALSDYVVDQLREHYALPPTCIRKVFNGVDPDPSDGAQRAKDRREVRKLYGIGAEDTLILLVAHNFKLKGVRQFLDAMTLLRERGALPGVKALIVGRERATAWQQRAARRGLDDVVQFPGPTQRIRAFYHAADLLVHPTFYDPCSRVVLEALASGLPAITTRYDGAAEAIIDGVTGYVVTSPEDVAALAERIHRLLDIDVREPMRLQAAETTGRFDMRRHAEQVAEVYRTLVNGEVGR